MALYTQGILGPFSGKIGNVVGCMCKRRAHYMRIRPLSYNDAKTPEQLRNRAKMKATMAFLSVAKEFVNHTMEDGVSKGCPTNLAMRLNFHKVEVDENYSGRPKFDELVLSEGNLMGLDGALLLRSVEGLTLRWEPIAGNDAERPTDRVSLMVYNESKHRGETMLDVATRGAGEYRLQLPEKWMTDRLHVYVAVGDAEGDSFSDSQYFSFSGSTLAGATGSESTGRLLEFSTQEKDGEKVVKEQSAIRDLSCRERDWTNAGDEVALRGAEKWAGEAGTGEKGRKKSRREAPPE